jgi:hypothetical protein
MRVKWKNEGSEHSRVIVKKTVIRVGCSNEDLGVGICCGLNIHSRTPHCKVLGGGTKQDL